MTHHRLPEQSLTQEEVVQLLGQLHLSNLLQFDRGAAAASLFERLRQRRSREIKAVLLGFLSIKLPLLDPDRWLEKALPLIRVVFGPVVVVVAAVVVVVVVAAVAAVASVAAVAAVLQEVVLHLLMGGSLSLAKLKHV